MLYPNTKRPRTHTEIKLVFEAVKKRMPKLQVDNSANETAHGLVGEIDENLVVGNIQFSILLSL